MNHYELLAIISGKYAEPEAATIFLSLEDTIKKYASAFHYSQNLERKKLAYPIQRHLYGTYVLIEFDADPTTLKTIDHEMRHTNEIIRYTIVKKEKVGVPKKLEQKEQKTFASAPTQPSFSPSPHAHIPDLQDISADAHPRMQAPLEEPLQSPVLVADLKQSPDLDAALNAPHEELKAEPEDVKKKQQKVTYEELDKKLDEILNNTIL
jgi:small subunit ribosomal protein S6